jgi:hypothetical protein
LNNGFSHDATGIAGAERDTVYGISVVGLEVVGFLYLCAEPEEIESVAVDDGGQQPGQQRHAAAVARASS